MSKINVNVENVSGVQGFLFHTDGKESYGYRAFINGVEIGIKDIETVQGLQQIIPSINISKSDVEAIRKAMKK